jgi:glycosyltransferase involved in cell wall biosynthesis
MVNTPGYAATVVEPLHIGAASNKMIGVVRAVRDARVKAYLVSMPVLGQKARTRHVSSTVLRHRDGPQIFLPVVANRYIRKIYALFGFAWFCVVGVGKTDRVIIYNHAVEYLLGSLILALGGNRPILDVEDAPRKDEPGFQGFVGRALFYLFNRVTRDRKLIVSHALAKVLGLQEYCVVYGATRRGAGAASIDLHQPPWGKAMPMPVRIHYGGSLTADTGVDLFCEAVDLLIGSLQRDVCRVHFVVTGFGSDAQIKEMETRCTGTGVSISFYPDLSPDEYLHQFRRCHAALSLKLPESEMAMTTFPSKVVEITSHGLLLISTKASDVPLLFDASSAVLLPEATPAALASAITSVAGDLPAMQQVARRGQERAMELFESRHVGKRIVDFVMNSNA